MNNNVDQVLYDFLCYQEKFKNGMILISFVIRLKTIKTAIERNIPSKHDLDIINFLTNLIYLDPPNNSSILDEATSLKNSILDLYSKRNLDEHIQSKNS